jgi:hypothetical protein
MTQQQVQMSFDFLDDEPAGAITQYQADIKTNARTEVLDMGFSSVAWDDYVDAAEHQEGFTFWDRFGDPLEAAQDFVMFTSYEIGEE